MKHWTFNQVKQEFKEWINNLPAANPLRSSELIYNKLAELPITEMTALEALELLEMLIAPIHIINQQLQQHLADKGAQTIIETDKQITIAMSLFTRYASAYSVPLSLTVIDEKLPNSESIMAICIHHALSYLSRVLLVSYQLYRVPPPQLWLKLHKLYLQAEKTGLQTISVPHSDNEAKNIEEAYKICCLLASANPYQLRAIDMLKLYEALIQWADYTKIITTELHETLILLKLDEDTPPFYQKVNTYDHSPFLRGLDTTSLIEHILSSIKQHSHSLINQQAALPPTTLQNIAHAWSRFSGRLAARNLQEGNIQVSIGLTATHVHMASKEQTSLPENTGEKHSDTANEAASIKQDISNIKIGALLEDLWDKQDYNYDKEIKQSPTHYPVFTWQIINNSSIGYCLQSSVEQMIAFESGELVGLRSEEEDAISCQIGVIRWVKKVSEYHFQLGIMVLAPRAIPITVEVSNNQTKHQYRAFLLSTDLQAETSKPATFLPQDPKSEQHSIVIPALDLIASEKLIILADFSPTPIHLTEPLYLNSKFYQFKYEVLNDILST